MAEVHGFIPSRGVRPGSQTLARCGDEFNVERDVRAGLLCPIFHHMRGIVKGVEEDVEFIVIVGHGASFFFG
jgi:hypothetical protein